ncbi:MAG TPA: stage III sporulation protein AD [Firmicutes bacterium]|nr:stage III sporulation protein AD [Bacillota bacterium]HHY97290.1 stage III sporulation protein AD [Bacillota bacterium]
MDVIRVIGVCLVAAVLIVLIRLQRPEIAMALSVMVGISIFMYMIPYITHLISVVSDFVSGTRMGNVYLASVLKAVGIAYVAGFGAEISRDAGEHAIAAKIEFAGKVAIMLVALPVMAAILDTVVKFLD